MNRYLLSREELMAELDSMADKLGQAGEVIEELSARNGLLERQVWELGRRAETPGLLERQLLQINRDMANVEQFLKQKEEESAAYYAKYRKYKEMSVGLHKKLVEAVGQRKEKETFRKFMEEAFIERHFGPGVSAENFRKRWAKLHLEIDQHFGVGLENKVGSPAFDRKFTTILELGKGAPTELEFGENQNESNENRIQKANGGVFEEENEEMKPVPRGSIGFGGLLSSPVPSQPPSFPSDPPKTAPKTLERIREAISRLGPIQIFSNRSLLNLNTRLVRLKLKIEKLTEVGDKQRDRLQKSIEQLRQKTDEVELLKSENISLKAQGGSGGIAQPPPPLQTQNPSDTLAELNRQLQEPVSPTADTGKSEWLAEKNELLQQFNERVAVKDQMISHLQEINKQLSKLVKQSSAGPRKGVLGIYNVANFCLQLRVGDGSFPTGKTEGGRSTQDSNLRREGLKKGSYCDVDGLGEVPVRQWLESQDVGRDALLSQEWEGAGGPGNLDQALKQGSKILDGFLGVLKKMAPQSLQEELKNPKTAKFRAEIVQKMKKIENLLAVTDEKSQIQAIHPGQERLVSFYTSIREIINESQAAQERRTIVMAESGLLSAPIPPAQDAWPIFSEPEFEKQTTEILAVVRAALAQTKILEAQVSNLQSQIGERREPEADGVSPRQPFSYQDLSRLPKGLLSAPQLKDFRSHKARVISIFQRVSQLVCDHHISRVWTRLDAIFVRFSEFRTRMARLKSSVAIETSIVNRNQPDPAALIQTQSAPPDLQGNGTLEAVLSDFKSKLVKAEYSNLTLVNELTAIKTERNFIQSLLDDKMQAAQARLEEAQERNQRLTKEIAALRGDLRKGDLKSQVADLYGENDQLQAQIRHLSEQLAHVTLDKESAEANFRILKEETAKIITEKSNATFEKSARDEQSRLEMSRLQERSAPYLDLGNLIGQFFRLEVTPNNLGKLMAQTRKMMEAEEYLVELRTFFRNKLDLNLEREALKEKVKDVAMDWHLGNVQKHLNTSRGSLIQ